MLRRIRIITSFLFSLSRHKRWHSFININLEKLEWNFLTKLLNFERKADTFWPPSRIMQESSISWSQKILLQTFDFVIIAPLNSESTNLFIHLFLLTSLFFLYSTTPRIFFFFFFNFKWFNIHVTYLILAIMSTFKLTLGKMIRTWGKLRNSY